MVKDTYGISRDRTSRSSEGSNQDAMQLNNNRLLGLKECSQLNYWEYTDRHSFRLESPYLPQANIL